MDLLTIQVHKELDSLIDNPFFSQFNPNQPVSKINIDFNSATEAIRNITPTWYHIIFKLL